MCKNYLLFLYFFFIIVHCLNGFNFIIISRAVAFVRFHSPINFLTKMNVYNSEECLDLLNLIEDECTISQRELSRKSKISLGKVNYCIKALIEIGYIKIKNFKNSDNKFQYSYILTPSGLYNKTLIAKKFLILKQQEYDKIKSYIYK